MKKRSRSNNPQQEEVEEVKTKMLASVVVVGGGIAGVCCAQQLAQLYPNRQPSSFDIELPNGEDFDEEDVVDVLLISATPTLVEVCRLHRYSLSLSILLLKYHHVNIVQKYLCSYPSFRRDCSL